MAKIKVFTDSERQQALHLYRQGLSYKEIGRRMGRSDRGIATLVVALDIAEEEAMPDDLPLTQLHPFDSPGGYDRPYEVDMGRLPVRLPRVVRLLHQRGCDRAD